jgi:membrane protein required for colicin V production
MTGFDFTVVAILLVSSLLGLWRGLVYAVLTLLGWPLAFVLSRMFAPGIAPLLPFQQEAMRITAAYVLVFIAALIVWGIVVWMLSRLVKAIGLGWLDRVLGGLFGVLRGGMVILALVWLAGMTRIPEEPFWRSARFSKTAEEVALQAKAWLPGNISQRIHYGARG